MIKTIYTKQIDLPGNNEEVVLDAATTFGSRSALIDEIYVEGSDDATFEYSFKDSAAGEAVWFSGNPDSQGVQNKGLFIDKVAFRSQDSTTIKVMLKRVIRDPMQITS